MPSTFLDPQLLQFVPDNDDGTVDTTFAPWYDGNFGGAGVGDWLPYNHQAGAVAGSGGSTWYGSGTGMGADARYMQLAKLHFVTAPYFAAFKVAQGDGGTPNLGSIGTEWAPATGVGYSNMATFWGTALTRAAAGPASSQLGAFVPKVEFCVIDTHRSDVHRFLTEGTSYQANLLALIAALRTLFGTSPWFGLVMPHPQLWATTVPGAAIGLRAEQLAVAKNPANRIIPIDMGFARAQAGGLGSRVTVGLQMDLYDLQDTLKQGDLIFDAWIRKQAPTPPRPKTAFPVYLFFGDSICQGNVSAFLVQLTRQASLLGPNPPASVRENQWIWNDIAATWELYNPGVNSNTLGTVDTDAGPELTLLDALADRHPDGFGLIKMGINGAALARAAGSGRWAKGSNEHYPVMVAAVHQALDRVRVQFAKHPDFRGAAVILGQNDATGTGGGTQFVDAIDEFCTDLRADLTTRDSEVPFPIAWLVPHIGAANLPAESSAIRTKLQSKASETAFHAVNVDDGELSRDDRIHQGFDLVEQTGRRLGEALTGAGALV